MSRLICTHVHVATACAGRCSTREGNSPVFLSMARGAQPQQYEYLLFGSVQERDVPALLQRLRGLCDYATTGGIPFSDKEITYKIGKLSCFPFARVNVSV